MWRELFNSIIHFIKTQIYTTSIHTKTLMCETNTKAIYIYIIIKLIIKWTKIYVNWIDREFILTSLNVNHRFDTEMGKQLIKWSLKNIYNKITIPWWVGLGPGRDRVYENRALQKQHIIINYYVILFGGTLLQLSPSPTCTFASSSSESDRT